MIYTVTFNPAIDCVVGVQEVTLGVINKADSENMFIGGKGVNVSIVLKNLGYDSTALGFAAGFTGDAIIKGVEKAGITSDFIRLKQGNSRINVKIKSMVETEINCGGPLINKEDIEQLFAKLDKLANGDILVLAGSIPNTLPDDIYEQIIARIADRDVEVIVDATGKLLLNVLKYKPFLIKPNHFELSEMFDVELRKEEDIVLYANKLRDMGAKNVLVSRGKYGAVLVDEEGKVHVTKAPAGTVRNSVGAGDSMVAGFIAGYIASGDKLNALKLAIATGSATAFSMGLATREAVQELYNDIIHS